MSSVMFASSFGYAFRHVAVVGKDTVLLADDSHLFVLNGSSSLVRLEMDSALEIKSLKTSKDQVYLFTADKLYVMEPGTDSHGVAKGRFSPRVVLETRERDLTLDGLVAFDSHGDQYFYSASQSQSHGQGETKSRVTLLNRRGLELFVRDPPASLTITLHPSAESASKPLELQETVRVVESRDVEVKARPAAGNKKREGYEATTFFDVVGGFEGHTWNASMEAGEGDMRLDWFVGEPRQFRPDFMAAGEEVVDVSCVERVCAFLLRSHLILNESRLVFVEDLTRVVNSTNLAFGPSTLDWSLVTGFVFSQSPLVYSWFAEEETSSSSSAEGGYKEYRLDMATSAVAVIARG